MTETLVQSAAPAQCWSVNASREWAQFYIRAGQRPLKEGGAPSTWINLAVNSSFGAWAFNWWHCGPGDWRLWLADSERDYLMGKLCGSAYRVDDIDGTAEAARRDVLEDRRRGEITRAEAREAWEACEEAEGADTMADALEALSRASAVRSEYWELARTKPRPAAVAFWERLWTPWVAQLAREALSEAQATALIGAKSHEDPRGFRYWSLSSGSGVTISALERRGLTKGTGLTYSGLRAHAAAPPTRSRRMRSPE